MATEATPQVRRPFKGSCHCGSTKYIVYINTPHKVPSRDSFPVQVTYRCNCTACHKTGILHLRLESAPDDFILLSPLDPLSELGDYQCNNRNLHWLFCKTCGVRCFTFMGKHEVVEDELPGVSPDGEKTRFWHVVKEGWVEGGKATGCYLSVNTLTLDAGQDGIDLVEWTEKKKVMYADNLELDGKPKGERSLEKPFPGGCF
ncbi:hypothetical protein GQ53DRAFT_742194 [Thozetella sp. PMI_491]|nr:hypothetical protein GQ53DRAFT_742194 [Thozetella sp. PMI_491]